MHVARRTRPIASDRANFLEPAIGFIEPMLALHDKGIVVHHVPMQDDFFVGVKFEQDIDNIIWFVYTQNRIVQML
jgi:hypothetical protein